MSKNPEVKTDSEILRSIELEYYVDPIEEGFENELKRIRAISTKYSKEDISKARKALIDKYISEFEAQYFAVNPTEENDRLVKRLLGALPKRAVGILNENKNEGITLKMREFYIKDGAGATDKRLDESILLENTRKKIEAFKEGICRTLDIPSGPDDSGRKTYLKNQLETLEEVPRYKKELPKITVGEFSGMKNGDIIEASWTYEGPDQNGLEEDKYSDMHLVKRDNKIYIFCKKQDEEYECKEVKNVEEVVTAVQSVGPDKQGNEYLNTPNKIKTGRLIKVGETRTGGVADPNLVDQKLKNLLVKLEGDKGAIDDSDKSLLLMISEVFIANNGMSELFQRPLSLEETTDFLRFLTKGIGSMNNPTFAARIILCDQDKLNRIKTTFGVANSFASEFFQGSQHVQYTKDNFITSGPDTKFSEVLAKEGESEKEAAKKTREDGNAKREALKQEILSGNKACLYSSGAHHIGLVFGPEKSGRRQIYIQDSTENITEDTTKNYERAIKQFYTGEYNIVKTVQKKDTKSMFASQETGPGIQNQCRYSAIIFSERVLAEVKAKRSPAKDSIRYGQVDFEHKFVEWFDKSQLGQEISGPKKSPAPEVKKPKSEFVTLEYKGKAGSKAKIAQLTREQILGELYSDHLPQVFNIKLKGPEKAGAGLANESNVNILSWNVLGQCTKEVKAGNKDLNKAANNPWNYSESDGEFKARRVLQNASIAAQVGSGSGKIDIICLQEYTVNDDEEASRKLCEELKTRLGGGWNYEFSKEEGKKKSNVTFYNGAKLQVVGGVKLGLNTNSREKKPFNCATELKFKSIASNQEFFVSNVHATYGKKEKVEEYLSQSRDLPFFAVGDFNGDANSFDKTHRPVAPNGATNFDAPLKGGATNYDRRDDAEMVVQNKCYDMAFAVLPTGFKAEVRCVGRVFNEGLQSISDGERSSSFGSSTAAKTAAKPLAKPAAKASAKTNEEYQLDLLNDKYFDELTRPLKRAEIEKGFLGLEPGRNGVDYKEIEALNPLPVADKINAPLRLKRSQPSKFLNDEFIGEDVQAYYQYLFTKKYPQAVGFADYGSVGIVRGAEDLLANRMAETIKNKKWGFYSYSTGGHWVLVVLSPDKKVTYLNSVGEGEIAMNEFVQADINRAFTLAVQGGQAGKTKAYGLNTQLGVQCGVHSVLAAEEILRELVRSSENGGMPTFSMEDVIKKCTTPSDRLHKKPTIQEILTVRWNASSEQFKNQRADAYQKVIATKENLIKDELLALKESHAKGVDINRLLLHSSGNFSASEVARSLKINLSEKGGRAAEEIERLKNAREADSIKYQMEAFGETSGEVREAREPEPEEEFSLDRVVFAYYKTLRELTRDLNLASADETFSSKDVTELFSLYTQNTFGDDQAAFSKEINGEKTKAVISEEFQKKEEKREADSENLKTLKKNLTEARALVKMAPEPDIASMNKAVIIAETMGCYEKYLKSASPEEKQSLLSKIFEQEEYSSITVNLFPQEPFSASELSPQEFLEKSIALITSSGNQEISIRGLDSSSEVEISDEIATKILGALKNPNCRVTNNEFGKNKIDPEILGQINDQLKTNKSQNAFQDAVYDVFKHEGKSPASAQERARLRDQLADAVLPDYLAEALRAGNEQLDGAEFMTHFLDAIMPEKNKIKDTLTTKWGLDGSEKQREKKENSCKLDLPFISSKDAKGPIKCSEMLSGYRAEEDMKGDNKFEYEEGQPKVDAKISRSPVVTDPGEEIVVSLKRFKEDGAPGRYVRIGDPVNLDPIELDVEGKVPSKQKYNATAFIVHRGGMGGGHYVAYIQEDDEKWYCYNDSSKGEVEGEALEAAKSQAYVVKYSPVGTYGKCKLPKSQGDNGTANGGNRCWANAAFAFALSMVSLHDDARERGVVTLSPQESYEDSCLAFGNTESAEELLVTVLELDSSEEKSLKDVIEALQRIDELSSEEKEALNQRLEEIGVVSTSMLLANTVEEYLVSLIKDQEEGGKIEAILGLQGFLSDEGNKGDALKIFNAIEGDKDAFIDDPEGFCSKLISSDGATDSKKELLKSKARRHVTTADLCYDAISAGNIDNLKELLPYAIKQDKEFLTNALCYAVVGEKTAIANFLIDEFKANPNKESSLYEKTANDLDAKKILQKKSGSKGGLGGSGLVVDSDSEFDEESLDGSEEELSKEIEIERMKVGKDKTITLDLKDGKTDKDIQVVIDVKKNKFLEVGDTSSGEPQVKIKNEDFRKELMKYYLSGRGKNETEKVKYEAPKEEMKKVGKEAIEVLNIYRAVPSTSIAARSASKVIVGDLIRGR